MPFTSKHPSTTLKTLDNGRANLALDVLLSQAEAMAELLQICWTFNWAYFSSTKIPVFITVLSFINHPKLRTV